MNAFLVGLIVFACSFGGALLGNRLRSALPDHHLDTDSKDSVKLAMGLIATMTALIIGLITASEKNAFDAIDTTVKQSAVNAMALDRTLARYGAETAHIRSSLQRLVAERVDAVWTTHSNQADQAGRAPGLTEGEVIAEQIAALKPANDVQRVLQSRAVDLGESLLRAGLQQTAAAKSSVPDAFLIALFFWLAVIFVSFGLYAPSNGTVLLMHFLCALSVATALFIILEMDSPFDGFIRVSADPLRHAYEHMNR